ncbi:MAG: hypothetical protein H6772_00080 [Pseudomonadales bacterium]|nr:hypothetical protein [Pseudomonadales bacterium]
MIFQNYSIEKLKENIELSVENESSVDLFGNNGLIGGTGKLCDAELRYLEELAAELNQKPKKELDKGKKQNEGENSRKPKRARRHGIKGG